MKHLLCIVIAFGIANAFCQIPIANLPYTQDNFQDLNFLKEELKGKDIICLGEEWHFTETFSQVKNRIIKYLHQELGYNIILFESSFQGAWIAELENLEHKERLFETVQTIWRTESVLNLFDYISESKKEFIPQRPISQYGFDLYGTYTDRFKDNLANYLSNNYPTLTNSILPIESKIQADFLSKHRNTSKKKIPVSVTIDDIFQYKKLWSLMKTESKSFTTAKEQDYFVRAIENRILLAESLISKDPYFREQVMSDNISWILNHLEKEDKVIIWAADIHISKAQKKTVPGGDRSMIERLPKLHKDRIYSLSLIPIDSAPKKLRKELQANENRFFFYPLSEDNAMRKRQGEFDGMIICKEVERIDNFMIE